MRRWRTILSGAVLALAVGVLSSCDDDAGTAKDAPESAQSTATKRPPDPLGFDAVLERFGCTPYEGGDDLLVPIRSGAATRGMRCEVDGATVDIFERAPAEPTGSGSVRGSVETISRVLGVGSATEGCDASVLITDQYFAVANEVAALGALTAVLGPAIQPVSVASPTMSYLPNDCALAPV